MGVVKFTKSHGLGNDFIIIEDIKGRLSLDAEAIRKLCRRKFGIGADGLILIKESQIADYFMDYRNADGSIAEMCGNGIRVFAKYVYDNLLKKPGLKIETRAGVKDVKLSTSGRGAAEITVDMGKPELSSREIPVRTDRDNFIDAPIEAGEIKARATCVSMGNPHCVIFVDNVDSVDVGSIGPMVENLEIFPEKVNVEFVQAIAKDHLKVRVWERGVGETLACGTGACAALVAAGVNDYSNGKAKVTLPGGELSIELLANGHVVLTGGVQQVFSGEIDLDRLEVQGDGIE